MDLISRQEAVKEARELFEMGECYCDKYSIVGMLNGLPSAEPEIIRCRDCKHADDYYHCSFVNWWTDPDDYCSRAERRPEIIRCRDCIHWDSHPSHSAPPLYHSCDVLTVHTTAEGFCSLAERRQDALN